MALAISEVRKDNVVSTAAGCRNWVYNVITPFLEFRGQCRHDILSVN